MLRQMDTKSRPPPSGHGLTGSISSSSSATSSLSSSVSSSMLHPASSTSLSDIDGSGSSSSLKLARLPPNASSPASYLKALPKSMGGVTSRPSAHGTQSDNEAPPLKSPIYAAATATSGKLKRALAGRRKKADESNSTTLTQTKSRTQDRQQAAVDTSAGSSSPTTPTALSSHQRHPKSAKEFTMQIASSTLQAIAGRKHGHSSGHLPSPSPPPLLPPPPPPKPPGLQAKKPIEPPARNTSLPDHKKDPVTLNAGSLPAVEYMRSVDQAAEKRHKSEDNVADRPEERRTDKDDWRKSDATVTTHSPRPRASTATAGAPRPVSIAESIQSVLTITPTANKRLSALVTDAEFVTPEEEEARPVNHAQIAQTPSPGVAVPRQSSPTSSIKARNRRSISLNMGLPLNRASPSPPSLPSVEREPGYFLDGTSRSGRPGSKDPPALDTAAAQGIISPSNAGSPTSSTGSHIKGRLAPWSTAPHTSPGLAPPPTHPARPTHSPAEQVHPSLRQTALSMTSGTAGFAMGFGKRAVERVGRWGGFGSSGSSSHAPGSLATPGAAPSSYQSGKKVDDMLGRTLSNNSAPSGFTQLGKGKGRRTPNAPSASWSINSSGTGSSADSDQPMPVGPSLGPCLRTSPRGSRGAVFGRLLQACVNEAPAIRRNELSFEGPLGHLMAEIEQRRVPALVVRCAQHILRWGIEEEGLFRISGRSSHIAKLRAEFDNGADYDLVQASPGDLDPHAVASVFKAYLRELPEPILTQSLQHLFDVAMNTENEARAKQQQQAGAGPGTRTSNAGIGLPSGPKSGATGLRKPPSLSTLAMPNFSGMRPPSQALLNALTSLVWRMPAENRDLLHTVADLIRQTAIQAKVTKMPMSNLLLVFCPSLNMQPPLLRVLCESDALWTEPVVDMKPHEEPIVQLQQAEAEAADTTSEPSEDSDEEDKSDNEVTVEAPHAEEEAVDEAPDSSPVVEDYLSEPTSGTDDAASTNSTSEASLTTPPNSASNVHLRVECFPPTPLTAVPAHSHASAASAGDASPSPLDTDGEPKEKQSPPIPHLSAPEATEYEDLSVPTPRQPVTNPMFQFPAIGGPPSPGLPESGTAPSSPIGRALRMKRPSLTLLFSRRTPSPRTSAPSSPYVSAMESRSSSLSSSTGSAMVTASGSAPALPPKLEMPELSSSPIRLGGEMDFEGETARRQSIRRQSGVPLASTSMPVLVPPTEKNEAPVVARSESVLSLYTDDEPQDDWANSVLLAADVGVDHDASSSSSSNHEVDPQAPDSSS